MITKCAIKRPKRLAMVTPVSVEIEQMFMANSLESDFMVSD